jgi:hypothetical protein
MQGEEIEKKKKKKKNAAIQADADRFDFSKRLNRTGWTRHLKGSKRDWWLEMAQTPTFKERTLSAVCWAAEMVLWRAQQVSNSSVVGIAAMMYINRRELGNTSSEKLLNASQTGKTMRKYRDVGL